MFAETEVPAEGETFAVPVKATATGEIVWWLHRPEERILGERVKLEEGVSVLCVIEPKADGSSETGIVTAPVTGHLVKIIKEAGKAVKEGETIGEMIGIYPVPPWILEQLGPGEDIV
jgi:biotin carboxyl carrier protein